MNNPLFAPGSVLGNAFNDIFKTDAETSSRLDVAVPPNTSPSTKETSADAIAEQK